MSSINQTFINYNVPEIIPEINVSTLNVDTECKYFKCYRYSNSS